jgi:hypothetical protein
VAQAEVEYTTVTAEETDDQVEVKLGTTTRKRKVSVNLDGQQLDITVDPPKVLFTSIQNIRLARLHSLLDMTYVDHTFTRDDVRKLIQEVDVEYEEGDVEYDVDWLPDEPKVSQTTKTLVDGNSFPFLVEGQDTSLKRDSKDRVTEIKAVQDTQTRTYTFTWDEETLVTCARTSS